MIIIQPSIPARTAVLITVVLFGMIGLGTGEVIIFNNLKDLNKPQVSASPLLTSSASPTPTPEPSHSASASAKPKVK